MSDSLQPYGLGCQAPLSRELSRQEYWSELPFSSPGDLPDPGTEATSPALSGRFFATEPILRHKLGNHMFLGAFEFTLEGPSLAGAQDPPPIGLLPGSSGFRNNPSLALTHLKES